MTTKTGNSIIKLDNVSVNFAINKNKKIDAVTDIDLSINQGEIFGIVGYSGAGKSTLIRTINLLQKPTSGNVYVHNQSIVEAGKIIINEGELSNQRRKIGMIFQQFNLLEQSTVFQNVAFALKHSQLSKERIEQRVNELLDLVGLSDRANHYPAQLSGGQKQRVAIARALANDPDILISDEATSALDVKTTDQILDLLDQLNSQFKLTIVMVTHEMQVVKRIADRIAVMEKGKIIETGTTKDLFSKPKNTFTKELVESTKERTTFHKGVNK